MVIPVALVLPEKSRVAPCWIVTLYGASPELGAASVADQWKVAPGPAEAWAIGAATSGLIHAYVIAGDSVPSRARICMPVYVAVTGVVPEKPLTCTPVSRAGEPGAPTVTEVTVVSPSAAAIWAREKPLAHER